MKSKIIKWKTCSSKVILDHPRLSVSEDVVMLPDGAKTTYVRHSSTTHHSVAIVAVNSKKQVLIQKEYSHPPNKVMWQLPGGSMNKGESIKTAALRELAEESGYSAKNVKKLGYFTYITDYLTKNSLWFCVPTYSNSNCRRIMMNL